jgi:hypothetical protein
MSRVGMVEYTKHLLAFLLATLLFGANDDIKYTYAAKIENTFY